MSSKECDPKCTGRCNKNRTRPGVLKANKGCDPRCTGRCSKKNAGTSITLPPEDEEIKSLKVQEAQLPETQSISIASKKPEGIEDLKSQITTDQGVKFLPDGQIGFVIVDLDGVILDTETVYGWVITDLVNKYGVSQSEIQKIIDLQDEETAGKFCQDYNCPISPNDFMVEFQKTSIKHLANTPLMPGINELVAYFHKNNYLIAVATTSNKEIYTIKTRKHVKFFKNFSHIVLGGSDPEVTERKPSPMLYTVCGSRFQSNPNPNSILVLEDAPEGVEAAKGAGMNAVWFPNKYMNKEDDKGALVVLNSIKEFIPEQYGLLPLK